MERERPNAGRAILLAAVVFASALAGEAATGQAPRAELELIRANLAAAGIEGADALYHHQTAVLRALDEVERRMGRGDPTYPRARRLHQLLHKHFLRDYRPGADGVWLIPDLGRFNCLSASLFYGLAARRLGFGASLLHEPGHLLLRLEIGDRVTVVETTLRDGFDHPHRGESFSGDDGAPDLIPPTVGRHAFGSRRLEFALESTVGFTWLNRAWRTLERGGTTRSADYVWRASTHLPALDRIAGARGLLARAFGADYESGRFEDAYHVASIETRLFPEMTTSRDRLLAVALKRIEDAADADDPATAETILVEVGGLSAEGQDFVRLERRAWPIIAAAAVRLGDWERARRAAHSYAEVEPDAVETERLVSWVASRRREAP